MKSLARNFVLLAVALALIRSAAGSSESGTMASQLGYLVAAIWYYAEWNTVLPTDDICDPQGRPLLSWRVRVLRHLSTVGLYEQFHLDEPWDSPHNRELIEKIPSVYRNEYEPALIRAGRTQIVALRGRDTFFGLGKDRRPEEIKSHRANTVMLVRSDVEHAPIWTMPEDLAYDAAAPTEGLGYHWLNRISGRPCALLIMADRKVRLLDSSVDTNVLRRLCSIENQESANPMVPWFHFLSPPEPLLLCGSLLLSFGFIAGGMLAFARLVSGKPISPGEWLVLMVGAQQAAVLSNMYVLCPKIELLPPLYGPQNGDQHIPMRGVPAIIGLVIALSAAFSFPYLGRVRALFAGMGMLLVLVFLDAYAADLDWAPDHTLATIGNPLILGVTVLTLAFLTAKRPHAFWGDRRRHWACLLCSLLPLLWFAFWWEKGLVGMNMIGVRILD
jgi:hypothetical protein